MGGGLSRNRVDRGPASRFRYQVLGACQGYAEEAPIAPRWGPPACSGLETTPRPTKEKVPGDTEAPAGAGASPWWSVVLR